MTNFLETLHRFDTELAQTAPKVASHLQPGLTQSVIETKTAAFSWSLPQDVFDLYEWHNGLSGEPGQLNLIEKLLRVKGKWHGELSGRENEIHLRLGDHLIVAKFLPLDYALAGHRHLKLGRCLLDLLPFSILTEGETTIYCMIRLDAEKPVVYCANGTKLPPIKVTEAFLSTQPQFKRLNDLIEFLIEAFQSEAQPTSASQTLLGNELDYELSLMQFEKILQRYKD